MAETAFGAIARLEGVNGPKCNLHHRDHHKLGDALESADPGLVICDAEINAETALKFVPPGPLGAKASRSEIQDHDLWEKPANDPVDW